jgi:hypothetical protein
MVPTRAAAETSPLAGCPHGTFTRRRIGMGASTDPPRTRHGTRRPSGSRQPHRSVVFPRNDRARGGDTSQAEIHQESEVDRDLREWESTHGTPGLALPALKSAELPPSIVWPQGRPPDRRDRRGRSPVNRGGDRRWSASFVSMRLLRGFARRACRPDVDRPSVRGLRAPPRPSAARSPGDSSLLTANRAGTRLSHLPLDRMLGFGQIAGARGRRVGEGPD